MLDEEVDEILFTDFETFALNKVIDGHDPIACAMIMITLGVSACKLILTRKEQMYLLDLIEAHMISGDTERKKITLH